jgi:hypothetical protein
MSYRRWGAKEPGESGYFVMDFAKKLTIEETGDTEDVGSIEEVLITDLTDDSDVTAAMADGTQHVYTGQYVYLWIKGAGVSGREYLVKCTIHSSTSNQTFIGRAVLPVRE